MHGVFTKAWPQLECKLKSCLCYQSILLAKMTTEIQTHRWTWIHQGLCFSWLDLCFEEIVQCKRNSNKNSLACNGVDGLRHFWVQVLLLHHLGVVSLHQSWCEQEMKSMSHHFPWCELFAKIMTLASIRETQRLFLSLVLSLSGKPLHSDTCLKHYSNLKL